LMYISTIVLDQRGEKGRGGANSIRQAAGDVWNQLNLISILVVETRVVSLTVIMCLITQDVIIREFK